VKNVFFILVALFIFQSCGEEVPDQPQPISKELDLVSLNPRYIHGTYQFNGKVTKEMGSYTFVYGFSGKTTGDSFEIEWDDNVVSKLTGQGSLTINPKGGLLHNSGMDETIPDPSMAVAAATGISGGCAQLMYSLWIGDKISIFQSNQATVEVREHGRIVVKGKTNNDSRSFEIIVDNGLLSSVSDIYDPKLDTKRLEAPLISDDNIKEMLKKMNRPVNDEEIAKTRDILAKANESVKNVHDIIKSTTVITVTGFGN